MNERMKIFNERYAKHEIPQKYFEWFNEWQKKFDNFDPPSPEDGSSYDIADIPKYGLSCMWSQRSVDAPLGLCWNIVSYSILTHIIAKLVNMVPDELVGSLGDCHIYLNQIEGVKEHLNREGYDELPKLVIEGDQKCIEDFKYDDFKIFGYKCDPIIKIPLSVG
jgi:thymidylate synthase